MGKQTDAVAIFGMLLFAIATSGCVTADNPIPRDEPVIMNNVHFSGDVVGVSRCEDQYQVEYPDDDDFDCTITLADFNAKKINCRCIVHKGII